MAPNVLKNVSVLTYLVDVLRRLTYWHAIAAGGIMTGATSANRIGGATK